MPKECRAVCVRYADRRNGCGHATQRSRQRAGHVVINNCSEATTCLACKYLVGKGNVTALNQAYGADAVGTRRRTQRTIDQRTGARAGGGAFHADGLIVRSGYDKADIAAGTHRHAGQHGNAGSREFDLVRLLREIGYRLGAVNRSNGYHGIIRRGIAMARITIITGGGHRQNTASVCVIEGTSLGAIGPRTAETHADNGRACVFTFSERVG